MQSSPLGCCRSEIGGRRHVIEPDWNLPTLPPSRMSLSQASYVDLEARTGGHKVFLESVLSALHEEFARMREVQVQSEKSLQEQMLAMLQEQMLSMDAKLNHLVTQGNGVKTTSGEENLVPDSSRFKSVVECSPNAENGSGSQSKSSKSGKSKTVSIKIDQERTSRTPLTGTDTTKKRDDELMQTCNSAPPDGPEGFQCLARWVFHQGFDGVVSICILLNALLVGIQVNHDATSDESSQSFLIAESVFVCIFTVELILRVLAAGRTFCTMADSWFWPTFDTALVALSWLDFAMMMLNSEKGMPGPGASVAKILKMARMARIMRVLRMTRLLAKVRVMGTIIFGSMMTLIWLFVLLVVIIYLFAVWLTQGASEWLKGNGSPPIDHAMYDPIKDTFGTVPLSMLTLFESVTGGVSWGIPNQLAQELGPVHSAVFSGFVFFFFFSVLNIVTGVYVDGAIQQAHNDRTLVEMQKDMEKKAGVQLLAEALAQIDTDESAFITRAEWLEAMQETAVRNLMELLEVDTSDAQKLFDLVDIDGDDSLSITEFVDGMRRLRGHATSIDIHVLMCRLNYLISQIRHWFKDPHSDRYLYKITRDSSVDKKSVHLNLNTF